MSLNRPTKVRDYLKYSINKKDILTYYFYDYMHEALTKFWFNYHDVNMSIRAPKRRLAEYGLKKKDRTLSVM